MSATSYAGTAVAVRGLTDAEIQRARRVLMRRDPKLGAVIRAHGRCRLADSRTHEPFGSLVGTIISQQLSTKAAATIQKRVFDLTGGHARMTPDRLLEVETSALRTAGLSGQKVTYVRDLADKVRSGALDLQALDGHDDEEVIARITAVKGLGRWSAQMFLMFRLNRPDILPTGDLGIVKGFQIFAGMKTRPAERTMIRLAEPWRPYRSIACWYLWRLLE
jgi:DNA-3-methyladenine glycosylase II